jgi:uncharacterized lipoprotein YmbA
MNLRRTYLLGVGVLFASLGCGSSPDPIYYAMAPTRGVVEAGWAHVIELRRPALAGYLDREEIVSRVVDYRLRVAGGASWSEPLGDMIGRLIEEDLAERLPGSVVFTETSPISTDPDAVVSVDIQRFDRGDDGQVVLLAEVTVERPPSRMPIRTRRLKLQVRPRGPETAALVGAMSALLGQLADDVSLCFRSPPPTPVDSVADEPLPP